MTAIIVILIRIFYCEYSKLSVVGAEIVFVYFSKVSMQSAVNLFLLLTSQASHAVLFVISQTLLFQRRRVNMKLFFLPFKTITAK